MFYSGIDQNKRDCFIITYGPDGEVVNQERVRNSPMLIQRYFSQRPGADKAVVESTGSWYWLADLLEAQGVKLTLAHATRLKAISAAKVKTNKIVPMCSPCFSMSTSSPTVLPCITEPR